MRTRLQEWMHHFGLTQGQLGLRAGVPQPTIQRILSGATASPRIETLRKLIAALGLTQAEFDAGPVRAASPKGTSPRIRIPVISGMVDGSPLLADDAVTVDPAIFSMAGVTPEQTVAATAPHHSMAPTIAKGDLVLIDMARTELLSGHIFAVQVDDALVIRRVLLDDAVITLQPDNPDSSTYFAIQLPATAKLQVIGHVFWRGGLLA